MVGATPEDVVRGEFDRYDAFTQRPVDPDRLLRMVEALELTRHLLGAGGTGCCLD